MTKNQIAVLALLGLAALAGCRHPADYDGVRQRSDAAHQELDSTSQKPEYNPQ